MSYIGTQPVPQSLESRQEFTGDGSTTTFTTIGGVELYEDVFLNGVRLSRVDNEYSFDGTTLTITPAPANGDTISIILRNDHSDLVALPITDSAGNNVLSESGGVVTLTADQANVGSNALVVDSSGNVGIGSSPSYPFQVGSSDLIIDSSGSLLMNATTTALTNAANFSVYIDADRATTTTNFTSSALAGEKYSRFGFNGTEVGSISIVAGGTTVAYNTSSDYRLKENITEITDGITRVKQLNPSRFNFIADPDRIVDGFIAHEIQGIVPEAVSGEKDAVNEDGSINPQGIDQSKLVPLLTAALQEAITLIESQQSQIDALTARIEALEATP